jgi:hypothetical protein
MKASLDYYTSAFGPYPYRELRRRGAAVQHQTGAFPSALALAEQNFTRTGPDVVALTFFGTAHETAHQWWAGRSGRHTRGTLGRVRVARELQREFVTERSLARPKRVASITAR